MDALEPKSQEALDHEAADVRPGRSEPNNLRDQLAVREGQRQWATPAARDWKDTGTLKSPIRRDGKHRVDTLGRQVGPVSWPTPTVDDANNVTRKSGAYQSLTREAKTWPTPKAQNACGAGIHGEGGMDLQTTIGGSLNPQFVAWLMGYPLDWCDMPEESQQGSPTVQPSSAPSEIQ
jgi:hypothetical protein